mgnify:CR=1 FL=1
MREERERQMRTLESHEHQQCKEGMEVPEQLHARGTIRVDAETETEEDEMKSHARARAIISESCWSPRRTIVFDASDCPELYGDDETGTEADDTEEEEEEEEEEGVDEEGGCEYSDADSITFAACPDDCACTCCAPEVVAPRANQGARRSRGCRPEAVAC